MGKKTGALIKEARTAAGLTQDALAKKIEGLSASDVSKAERGEKELTQAILKQIAKATGVTQASLLNAEKETAEKEPKTAKAAKTTKEKAAKAADGEKLTTAEKQLLTLYRKADEEKRKDAIRVLKGEESEIEQLVNTMLGGKLSMDKLRKFLK